MFCSEELSFLPYKNKSLIFNSGQENLNYAVSQATIVHKLFFQSYMKNKMMSRFTLTSNSKPFRKRNPSSGKILPLSFIYMYNTYFASNILSEYSTTTASSHNRYSTGSESQNLSILSPFDEQEEWHKISEILNSFGTNLGSSVKESTTPNNCKYKYKYD